MATSQWQRRIRLGCVWRDGIPPGQARQEIASKIRLNIMRRPSVFKAILSLASYLMLADLWRFRHLLGSLIARTIKSSYSGAFGGWLWVYIKPVIMVTAYYFVFEMILSIRVDQAKTGTENYSLFLLSGFIPWLVFVDSVMDGGTSLVREAGLLKKTRFPLELIPARSVLIAAIRMFPLLFLVWPLGMLLADGQSVAILYLPAWMLLQILFSYYLVLTLAILSSALRDIGMLVESVLPLLVFFAPVLYPGDVVPESFRWLLWCNPFTPLVNGFHDVLLSGRFPHLNNMAAVLLWILVFAWIANILLRRAREQLVDWL